MTILLVILYVLVCLFLVLVVLLQQGKGADLAGAFGGGGSQASFGPRAGTNIMHRMTTASFVLFVVLSLALAILSGKRHASVMESVATEPPPVTSDAPVEPGMATGEEIGEAVAVETTDVGAPVPSGGEETAPEGQ